MKKLLTTLTLVLVTLSGIAQTIGEAFYIYRNDGTINTFFRNEIDSMTYSYYDTDSIYYNEIVSQIVYTPDSIYNIPLAVIDSIGFVTPETKYQPGVILLEGEIRNYIIGADSLTVFFRADTPANILPRIGDKLVTTEMSDVFLGGFIGQVEAKEQKDNTIAVYCSSIGLDEVFECFYYSSMDEKPVNPPKSRAAEWDFSFYPGPYAFSFTDFLNVSFKPFECPIKFTPKFDVTIAPSFTGRGSIIVHPLKGVVISVDMKQRTTVTEDIAGSGEIENSHDFTPGPIPAFSIVPFVYIYGEVGAFLRANGKLTFEQHWKQSLSYNLHYEASYLPMVGMPIATSIPKISINGISLTNEHEGQCMVDGYGGAGVYGEIGIALLEKHVASTAFRFELGAKLGGDVMLYNSEGHSSLISTSTYEKLNSAELYLNGFFKVGLDSKLLKIDKGDIKLYEKEWNWAKFKLVPDFSNTTLTRSTANPAYLTATTTVSGGAIFPCSLGFRLFEGNNDNSIRGTNNYDYWSLTNKIETISDTFEAQSALKKYTVCPTVKLFGIEMLAKPEAEIESKATPITLGVENITETTAKVWGKIENHEFLDKTIWFGLGYMEKGNTDELFYEFATTINETGVFSVEFNDLYPNTTYNYFAFLIVDGIIDGEYYYGENKEFKTEKGNIEPYAVLSDDNTVLTFFYDGNKKRNKGMNWGNGEWDEQKENITKVVFDDSFENCTLHNTRVMFYGYKNLTTIIGISNLKTDSVTNMEKMFRGCESLKNLDLSSFNTANVTTMMDMFSGCSSLTSLDLSSFNTANVTDMYFMFSGCSSLKSLDLSNFNTANVTTMCNMFYGCNSLISLNLKNFDTAKVTNMRSMFSRCSSLTSLDLSSFSTASLSSLAMMARWMFSGCSSLKTIYANNWIKDDAGHGNKMFEGCSNLVGGKGTRIGSNLCGYDKDGNPLYYYCEDDGSAAHIDGGKDNPGLFTAK